MSLRISKAEWAEMLMEKHRREQKRKEDELFEFLQTEKGKKALLEVKGET